MIHWIAGRRDERTRPRHEVGEVVLADFGNFLEAGERCQPKARPLILLRVGDCQHLAAGLTTQERHLTTGTARLMLPPCPGMGLDAPSYLWSARPPRISRLNVRRHLGWIDREVVLFLAEEMPETVAGETFTALWRSALAHEEGVD